MEIQITRNKPKNSEAFDPSLIDIEAEESVVLQYESLETFWTQTLSQDLLPVLALMTSHCTGLKSFDKVSESLSAFKVRVLTVIHSFNVLIDPRVIVMVSMRA